MAKYPNNLALEQLSRRSDTRSEIATKVGLTAGFVSDVFNGKKTPGSAGRKKFLEVFGIPVEAWDQVLRVESAEPTARGQKEDLKAWADNFGGRLPTTLEGFDLLIIEVRKRTPMADNNREYAALAGLEGRFLQQRAKCEADLLSTAEAFADSPYFQQFCNDLLAALKDHPKAFTAVQKVVQKAML